MSAQPAYTPFSFETVFDAKGHVLRSATGKHELLNEEEVAAREAAAYERGRNDAMAQAERASAEAMGTLARMTQLLLGRLATDAESLRQDAVDVALATGRALASEALAQFPEESVLSAVQDAVHQLRDVPRLVVRLSPSLEPVLAERLAAVADRAGFAGSLVVRADPAVAVGDVSLEWAEGSIHRDRAAALAAIEDAAQRWLASANQSGAQLDLFSTDAGA